LRDVVEADESGDELAVEEVVRVIDGPQTPVSVVVRIRTQAEWTICHTAVYVCMQYIFIIKEIYIAPLRHAPKALCKQKVKCQRELLLNVREMLVMSHHHTAVQLANCSILQDQRQRSFCLRSRSSSVEQCWIFI